MLWVDWKNCFETGNMSTATPEVPLHDRVYRRLSRLAVSAMLPWLLLSFISIMAFASPNAIITPLTWALLISVWCYPLVLLAGRGSAWVLRVYGQFDRANHMMSVPSALGAFLYSMLIVPVAVMPFFSDGYLGLMASCLRALLWPADDWATTALRRLLRHGATLGLAMSPDRYRDSRG